MMKQLFTLYFAFLVLIPNFAIGATVAAQPQRVPGLISEGAVSIGSKTAAGSTSLLDVTSTTKGSRPAPSMTQTQRDAISSPATGLQIYNTTTNKPNFYNGTAWTEVGSGSGGGSSGNVLTNAGFEEAVAKTGWTEGSGVSCAASTTVGYYYQDGGKQALNCTLTSVNGIALTQEIYSYVAANFEGSLFVKTSLTGVQVCTYIASTVQQCLDVPSTNTWTEISPTVIAPSNGDAVGVLLRTTSSKTGTVYVDSGYLGKNRNIGTVQQAKYLGSVKIPGANNCQWDINTTSYSAYSADADCGTPVGYDGATAPGTKVPAIVLPSVPQGRLICSATGLFGKAGAVNAPVSFAFYDGTNRTNNQLVYAQSNESFGPTLHGEFTYSSHQTNLTVSIQALTHNATNTARIFNSDANQAFEISCTSFPSQAEQVVRVGQGADLRGTLFYSPSSTCPANSVLANGGTTPDSITDLWGSTLPDLRGLVVAGAGTNSTRTMANGSAYSRTLKSYENDQLQGHFHPVKEDGNSGAPLRYSGDTGGAGTAINYGFMTNNSNAAKQAFGVNPTTDGTNGTPRTGAETRMANYALTPCIWTVSAPQLIGNAVTAQYSGVTTINKVRTVASATILTDADETVKFNTASGSITQPLPAAASYPGKKFVLRTISASNVLTIDPNGSETICGRATIAVQGANDSVEVQSDGSNWDVVAGGCTRRVAGVVDYACTSGTCTVTNPTDGIGSVTWQSTGGYRISMAWTSTSRNVTCTANSRYTAGTDMFVQYGTMTTTYAEISTVTPGTAKNAPFVFSCDADR